MLIGLADSYCFHFPTYVHELCHTASIELFLMADCVMQVKDQSIHSDGADVIQHMIDRFLL